MKNLAKVLSVVLALAMALSMVSFAAFSDVAADAKYGEAVSILSSLGVINGYEDGTFKPDETITRAQFAAVVCRLLGLGETAEGAKGQQVFNDVPADDWAAGYVALASQQKIVNGYGDGNFGPNDPVKYEEAIKMLVAACGYNPMAESLGGYPGGYQVVAAQRGILSGVNGTAGEAAPRSTVAMMSYNALEVPVMVQKGFGTQTTYEPGDQLLINKLGVVKLEGAVDATSASSDKVKEDQVKLRYDRQVTAIDGQYSASRLAVTDDRCNPQVEYDSTSGSKVYNTVYVDTGADKTVANDVIGLLDYNVVMYVKDADTEDATLVAIAKRGTRNSEVSFMTEDINDNKTTDSRLAVYTDKNADKYESYDLAIEKVYINGRALTIEDIPAELAGSEIAANTVIDSTNANQVFKAYARNYWTNKNGEDKEIAADIRLLCNNTAGDEYNVAYITAYTDYVVETKTDRTYTITTKESPYTPLGNQTRSRLILDEEDKDFRFDIMKDGKKVAFTDIQANDVLSVAGYVNSNNELEYGNVIITSTPVSGKISATDSVEGTIKVDGKDYKYNSVIAAKIESREIRLGDEATFYVNARGVLVGNDKNASVTNLKYGFATVVGKGGGINADYQIRLLNHEGAWQTVNFASKVNFNDSTEGSVSSTPSSLTLSKLAEYVGGIDNTGSAKTNGSDTVYVNKVVAYEANGEGKITKMYFQPKTRTEDIFNYRSLGTATYNAGTEYLGSVQVTDTTKIFSTKTAVEDIAAAVDEDDVSVATIDSLIDRDQYDNMYAYNVDDDSYAAVIYGVGVVGTVSFSSNFMTISRVSNQNSEVTGDEGYMFEGVSAGDEISVFAAEGDASAYRINFDPSKATSYVKPFESDSSISLGSSVSLSNLSKGDVILYSKNVNGEADTIYVLLKASDMVNSSATSAADSFKASPWNDKVLLAKFKAGANEYAFYYGYAAQANSSRVMLQDKNSTAYDDSKATAISFSSKAVASSYDAFTRVGNSSGKVEVAYTTDIIAEKPTSDYVGTGDMVFIRTLTDSVAEDVVIYSAYSDR